MSKNRNRNRNKKPKGWRQDKKPVQKKTTSALGGVVNFSGGHTEFTAFSKPTDISKYNNDNAVDLRYSDDFIKNGLDNFFPFQILDTVKKSMLQKAAFKATTSLVNGSVYFKNLDGSMPSEQQQQQAQQMYNDLDINNKKIIKELADSICLQGGAFSTFEFASNGLGFELARIRVRDYCTARLSSPSYLNGEIFYPRHYYDCDWGYRHYGHSRFVYVSENTKSWLAFQDQEKEKYQQEPVYVPTYDPNLNLSEDVNRMQSYFLHNHSALSDHYPVPDWYTAATKNYQDAEFQLSCFDIDEIKNGFQASGIIEVYHSAFIDPETSEAVETFDNFVKRITEKAAGAENSGSYFVVPKGTDEAGDDAPVDGTMKYTPFENNNNKDRHIILDQRIKNTVLGANGIVMPELIGIRDEKSTLSEGGEKLINAVKIFHLFTIKPKIELIECFLNDIINPMLGIELEAKIRPNLEAFLSLNPALSMHFLHPEQFYELYEVFGLKKPSEEQINSGLIPAYKTNENGSM